jgi:hypothetical protein
MSSWFVAVLVLRAKVGDTWQDEFLLDHQIRLVRAANPEAAFTRAVAIGEGEAHAYQNDSAEGVSWEFVGLADLEELTEEIGDGIEVWSWRSRGEPSAAVVAKELLSVFHHAANATRTAAELLDEDP